MTEAEAIEAWSRWFDKYEIEHHDLTLREKEISQIAFWEGLQAAQTHAQDMERKKDLKLFVWKEVLTDHSDGVMFAFAPDVETARKMLLEIYSRLPAGDLAKEPMVYIEPFALFVWGGS